ncbi:hypothetical protein C8Q74DRAFT_1365874 [Fomes fomentarius]|nr:hypothetical protein C8Q74DRAFT_1365874 [Fomes fomentarius]
MSTSFLSLPPELMLDIKERLLDCDLRTHVCLYLSHPTVAATLYDSTDNPDRFWALACWKCGIGSLPNERQVQWKEIAIDCITQDGFCKHPQCGEALLEHNRESSRFGHLAQLHSYGYARPGACMREAATEVRPHEPLQIHDYENQASLESHRIFAHMEFRRYGDRFRPHKVLQDAHLAYASDSVVPQPAVVNEMWGTYTVEPPDEYPGLYLSDHPLVTRTFATSPPVSSMLLLDLCGHALRERVLRVGRALTVLDVLQAMHPDLDHVLNMDEVREYVNYHADCFPKDWDYKTAFRTLRTIRSCLNTCPLEKLEHQENTEFGPAFSFGQK